MRVGKGEGRVEVGCGGGDGEARELTRGLVAYLRVIRMVLL